MKLDVNNQHTTHNKPSPKHLDSNSQLIPNASIPVTTDNARNIVDAVGAAELEPQIGCFGHVIKMTFPRKDEKTRHLLSQKHNGSPYVEDKTGESSCSQTQPRCTNEVEFQP